MHNSTALWPHFAGRRYYSFNQHLRETFGVRVQKLPLNPGLTCPNRDGTFGRQGCIYCGLDKGAAPHLRQPKSLEEQLAEGIASAKRKYGPKVKFIAYFQAGSNTYAPPDRLRALYDRALGFAEGEIIGLSVATRPDCLSPEVLALLAEYAQKCYFWLELGLQSANDQTLAFIQRGHTVAQFMAAVAQAKAQNLRVCAHVILGLPGEGFEDVVRTAEHLNRAGVDGVKLHQLYVLADAPLAELVHSGRYRYLSLAEYVDLAVLFLERLSPGVLIQRLAADPPADKLLGPAWAQDKFRVLQAIEARLAAKDTFQGRFFCPGGVAG